MLDGRNQVVRSSSCHPGPNPSGLPEGSKLLADFEELILSECKAHEAKPHKYHIHGMMTMTFSFLVKTLFHSISVKLNSLKATVAADGHVSGLEAVAEQFFSSSVSADLAIPNNPLEGLNAFLDSSNGVEMKTADALVPKKTPFQCLGDNIWIDQLKNLLQDIRSAGVSYLKNILSINT